MNLTVSERCVLKKFENHLNENAPVIFISSYEHHSNELSWREGDCEVVKIGLTEDGLFDLIDLEKKLRDPKYKNRLKIGSFSAASNVTGIKTPVYKVAHLMHKYNGYVFFDFASSGPYVDIDMTKSETTYFDGIYLSMHKFLGGPGASGILVFKNELYDTSLPPTSTGGGTVKFVTQDDHLYINQIEAREEAGTPGVMQVIRAAMALELKREVGAKYIEEIENQLITLALKELKNTKNLEILGNLNPKNRISILSFNIKHKDGYLHHSFVTTLLNDLFGIQARAGCSCAGPYGIELLDIDDSTVSLHKATLKADIGSLKPGWSRINFHYTMDNATFSYILEALKFVSEFGHKFLSEYKINSADGTWRHKSHIEEVKKLNLSQAMKSKYSSIFDKVFFHTSKYEKYLKFAYKKQAEITSQKQELKLYGANYLKDISWFYYSVPKKRKSPHSI